MDMAAGRDERRQDGGVVSRSRTDVDDDFARLGSDSSKESRMEKRLAIVDAFGFVQGDEHILVEIGRIGAWRLEVARADADLPRSRPHEGLAPNETKGLFQPFIRRIAGNSHHLRMEIPYLIQTGTAIGSHGMPPP